VNESVRLEICDKQAALSGVGALFGLSRTQPLRLDLRVRDHAGHGVVESAEATGASRC
jgi:hypothetical protein